MMKKKSYTMKKFSTGTILAIWIISILLILGIALSYAWYHLLTEDNTTTTQYQRDTCIIVDADIIEIYTHGVVVGYNGMRYNVPCEIGKIDLSKSIRVKIDTQGTETSLDDTLVKAFIE